MAQVAMTKWRYLVASASVWLTLVCGCSLVFATPPIAPDVLGPSAATPDAVDKFLAEHVAVEVQKLRESTKDDRAFDDVDIRFAERAFRQLGNCAHWLAIDKIRSGHDDNLSPEIYGMIGAYYRELVELAETIDSQRVREMRLVAEWHIAGLAFADASGGNIKKIAGPDNEGFAGYKTWTALFENKNRILERLYDAAGRTAPILTEPEKERVVGVVAEMLEALNERDGEGFIGLFAHEAEAEGKSLFDRLSADGGRWALPESPLLTVSAVRGATAVTVHASWRSVSGSKVKVPLELRITRDSNGELEFHPLNRDLVSDTQREDIVRIANAWAQAMVDRDLNSLAALYAEPQAARERLSPIIKRHEFAELAMKDADINIYLTDVADTFRVAVDNVPAIRANGEPIKGFAFALRGMLIDGKFMLTGEE